MNEKIIFQRNNQNIIAEIISTAIEPLESNNSKQVVFFCQDTDGKRYRVLKDEVIVIGKSKAKSKKKARNKNEKSNQTALAGICGL